MKFFSQVVAGFTAASCIFGAQGFLVQTPKMHTALHSTNSFSYSYGNDNDSSQNNTRVEATVETEKSSTTTRVTVPGGESNFGGPRVSNANGELVDGRSAFNPSLTADLSNKGDAQLSKNIWNKLKPVTVQGGSLRTCVPPSNTGRVQVLLRTDGRPLNSNIELWQGPDNTPQKMAVYVEDGNLRPFNCVIETPRSNNAVAIYNTGHLEFPMAACVEPDNGNAVGEVMKKLATMSVPKIIQGGAIQTYPFSPAVSSVQIMLKTDGRPLNARIELLQGPNNNKQVMEVYTEDGRERPFFVIIETPGVGNVVRVVNTGTVEFPLSVNVEPFVVDPNSEDLNGGWDSGPSWNSGPTWDSGNGNLFFAQQ